MQRKQLDFLLHISNILCIFALEIERWDTPSETVLLTIKPYRITASEMNMKATDVRTLDELVEFINEQDEWSNEVAEIIEANSWEELSDNEFDVCQDDNRKVAINEDGIAEVQYIF